MKRQASAEVRPVTAQDLLGSSGIDAVLHPEGAATRFSTGARSLGDYVDDVSSTARINAKAIQEKKDKAAAEKAAKLEAAKAVKAAKAEAVKAEKAKKAAAAKKEG